MWFCVSVYVLSAVQWMSLHATVREKYPHAICLAAASVSHTNVQVKVNGGDRQPETGKEKTATPRQTR